MKDTEFARVRHYLGKTQEQIARCLCVSVKAVQSFEQGWRKIPASAERQLLFLLALKNKQYGDDNPCWDTENCPQEWRDQCIAWELGAGDFCWFLNGTFCQGRRHKSWADKIELCRECNVFKSILL